MDMNKFISRHMMVKSQTINVLARAAITKCHNLVA